VSDIVTESLDAEISREIAEKRRGVGGAVASDIEGASTAWIPDGDVATGSEGWDVNRKRVQRLWRQEGLKVPRKTCKKRSRGNSENGTQRKSAERVNHVWSYGFVHDQTEDGRPLKWLPVMDRVQPGKSGTGGGPRDEGSRCSGSAGSAGGGARCARIHPE